MPAHERACSIINPLPSRERCWYTRSGRQGTRSESERRFGVLVILPEHKRIITALPGELRQQQNRGGGMEAKEDVEDGNAE